MQPVKLSIECSTQMSSFIISNHDKLISEKPIFAKSDVLIYQSIPEFLHQHQIDCKDISTIAWSRGPGSFTGIRICATWVQSLSLIHKISVIDVCSLKARVYAYVLSESITNGHARFYLKANRSFAYSGYWKINNGYVSDGIDIKVVPFSEISADCIDLSIYQPNAMHINDLSLKENKLSSIDTNPFSIRPNYMFNQFG